MEKTQEETAKPTIIVERPGFMEPTPKSSKSPNPKKPKQKTE